MVSTAATAGSYVDRYFEAAENRAKGYRDSAYSLTMKAISGGGGGLLAASAAGAGGGAGLLGGLENISQSLRQYQAYRDVPYTAIRPIAVTIAGRPVRVGRKSSGDGEGGGRNHSSPPGRAAQEREANNSNRLRRKQYERNMWAKEFAPAMFRKSIGDGMDVIDVHPLLDAIANPNLYLTGWATMYCTVASLFVTGRAVWWLNDEADENGNTRLRIYYLPTSWATPIHDPEPYAAWKISPQGSTETFTVPGRDVFHVEMPDPANPLGCLAPLQSQAKAVNTDDKVQGAQYATMANGPQPGMVLVAGRMPDPRTGSEGLRPILTPNQRKQLIGAINMVYRGVQHYGEPIILDGLIEDVYPYTRSPAEMGFMDGSALTKSRIMQGIGTSPVIAGQVEQVNRASSFAQFEIFYGITVNPVISLLSQSMTNQIGPRFDGVSAWLEECRAHDADLVIRRAMLFKSVWKKGEAKRFIMTGEVNFGPDDDDDEPVEVPRPMGGVGTDGAGAAGGGGGAADEDSGTTPPAGPKGANGRGSKLFLGGIE